MHIAYVIAPGGGPEAYVGTLLPWLEARGHRASVVYAVPSIRGRHPFASHVRVEDAPLGPVHYYLSTVAGDFRAWPRRLRAWEHSWSVYHALQRMDRAEPIDLVEVTEGLPITLLRRHWPVVVRAHGSDWSFRVFCQDGDRSGDHWQIDAEARQLREARAVSAISEHLADHLSEFCRFPREQIQVISYPIDTHHFHGLDQREASPTSPALLTIGRLEKRKGVDVLLKALSHGVWQHFPDLQVFLLGSEAGLTRRDLLDLVPADKRQQIIFPGFVNHASIPDYYRRATIYVAPTQYETFGYTILEAMACGLPVIASATGAVPELVKPGETGCLVPFGDPGALGEAIRSLLGNIERRERMGWQARERAVAEYDLDPIGERMSLLYQSITDLHAYSSC